MRGIVVALFASLLFGCGQPDAARVDATEESTGTSQLGLIGDFSSAVIRGHLDVRDAYLIGSIGDVELRHYATEVRSETVFGSTEITTTVEIGDKAAMILVRGPDLDKGEQAALKLTSCSRTTEGMWTYDEPLEEVELSVYTSRQIIRVDFSGRLVDYGDLFATDSDGYATATPEQIANLPYTTISGSLSFVPVP